MDDVGTVASESDLPKESSLSVSVFIADAHHHVLSCNTNFAEFVGKGSLEIIGFKLNFLLPDNLSDGWIHASESVHSSGNSASFIIEDESEGSILQITCSTLQIAGQNHFVGTFADISDLKKTEQKLLNEHQLLKTVVNILPAQIYAKDKESKFVFANDENIQRLGQDSLDQLVGKTDFDIFPYKYAIKYYCDEQEVIETGRPKINILEACSLDEEGNQAWLMTTKVPFRDSNGKIIGIVGSGVDVTQQKLLNDELQELKEIVNHSKSCAFLMDSHDNWRVSFCSKTVDIFGYTERDFMKDDLQFLEIVHPEDYERVKNETIEGFSEGKNELHLEYRIKVKQGGYRWVEDHKYIRIRNDDGSITFQSLITDISIRHQVQEERDQMETQLRQAQKLEAVGQLAAGIAHEINTPIQFISDNLEFLKDTTGDLLDFVNQLDTIFDPENPHLAEVRQKISELKESIDIGFLEEEAPIAIKQSMEGTTRVKDIVKAMKEFSHPGSGEITHEDINRAIENTITVARNEWKYVSEVEMDFDPDLASVPVDIGPFKQTILNLIVNGSHAIGERIKNHGGDKGLMTVSTRKLEGYVRISVKDTGTGMKQEVADRIFDPFYTTKEVGKGTGQGLSMAYDIVVRKHGGKLYFDTEYGVGTTFHIELPLEQN
jgi:PAS domain S-box-containing protein